MKINICLASDNNYYKCLVVTMASILKNAEVDDELYFYILENNILTENKNKIIALKKIKEFDITFVRIDDNIFEKFPNFKTLSYISKIAYARLVVADILENVDKILYLDCDIIVCNSLKYLYKQDIDNFYCAGIEDIGYYFFVKSEIYHISNIYINSGVLLLNLKLWRQNNILHKCIQLAQTEKFIFVDQDMINKVCENKIKLVDLTWNLQQVCFDIVNTFKFHPRKNEIKYAIKNYNIIHYTNSSKPWNAYTPLMNKYNDIARLVLNDKQSFKFKLKIVGSFCKYWAINIIYILRYIISPIFQIYRKKNNINIKILNLFEFSICKAKNKYFQT